MASNRHATILERKERTGVVVYTVLSSNGKSIYHTTVVHGHATACSCISRKPCYHMASCEKNEQERASNRQLHDVHSCPSCGQPRKSDTLCYRCA